MSLFKLPRGKVLGGSSAMYGMIYVRGAAADYDNWAYTGAPGWSYAEVLPFFIKSEDFEGGASAYHGVGGPLKVSFNHDPNPLTTIFLAAAAEAGLATQRRLQRARDPRRRSIAHQRQGRRPSHLLDGLSRTDRGRPAAHRLHRHTRDRLLFDGTPAAPVWRSRRRTASCEVQSRGDVVRLGRCLSARLSYCS